MTDRKHLCIVIDKFGNPFGPFEKHLEADAWARKRWPGEPFKDDGVEGWEIVVLRSPDE